MNPQQIAMLRMLLQQRPGVQPPPPKPGEDTSQASSSPSYTTGKDFNTGQDRWFIPDYNQSDPRAQGRDTPSRVTPQPGDQYDRHMRQQQLVNAMLWRNNQVPRDLAGTVLNRRPRDQIAGIPAFGGVDEANQAYKTFLTYGTAYPGFDPNFGSAKGYG